MICRTTSLSIHILNLPWCFLRLPVRVLSQRPSNAQTQNSAAGTATVCPPPSCVMKRRTVTTAVMKPPAHLLPAAPRISSAITAFVFHACGPATGTPTAPTALTSGPGAAGRREPPPLPLTSARCWSSAVVMGSASTLAGSVMEEPTASIDQTRATVV